MRLTPQMTSARADMLSCEAETTQRFCFSIENDIFLSFPLRQTFERESIIKVLPFRLVLNIILQPFCESGVIKI